MQLAHIFTDHMVLQRNKPIKIFGMGEGEVTVTFCGVSVKSQATENGWLAVLPPCAEGGPYTLEATDGRETVVLQDILVGDVWVIAGQSNAEMPLLCDLRGIYEAENCQNERIRFYTCRRSTLPEGVEGYFNTFDRPTPNTYDTWHICDREAALDFSALGYYLSKHLARECRIPLGIVSANRGGTCIEPWLPAEAFDAPFLASYREEFERTGMSDEESEDFIRGFIRRSVDYKAELERRGVDYAVWTEQMGPVAALAKIKAETKFEAIAKCKYATSRPSIFFEQMIQGQLAPLAVRGIVWYQGESNCEAPEHYAEKFQRLTEAWREVLEDKSLPFYTVEIAAFSYHWSDKAKPAKLRQEQHKAAKLCGNCHIITTQNLGEKENIHPMQKQEVARRVANQILHYEYGKARPCDGPVYHHCECQGNELWLYLENSEGLFGKDAENMRVAGEDGVFHKATCEIRDQVLVAKCQQVKKPVAARYCYENYYENAGIYNAAGLPLAPFTTEK